MISTRKAATRAQLIGATEALICEGGLAAVTTQSVARRGGFAEGTIYRHFDSRDELIVATLKEHFRGDFEQAVERLLSRVGKGEVETNLAEFFGIILPLYATIAPAIGMLAADPALAAKNAESIRSEARGPRSLSLQIGQYLRAEQELGRVDKDANVCAAAGLLVSVGFYRALIVHIMCEDPIGIPDADLAAGIAGIIARGVGASRAAVKTARVKTSRVKTSQNQKKRSSR